MAAAVLGRLECCDLLKNKSVYLYGCCNIPGLYKDLIWLIENGTLISNQSLRVKNEPSFANDALRASNDVLHDGVDYVEVCKYNHECYNIRYSFLTGLNLPNFIKEIENLKESPPDVIAISSCAWDVTRGRIDWPKQYEKDLKETFLCFKSNLPTTRIIWMTALPPLHDCRACVFDNSNVQSSQKENLHINIFMANQLAAKMAKDFSFDVLDYHHTFLYLMHLHDDDGMHWSSEAVRHMTNMLLTHLAKLWQRDTPPLPEACEGSIKQWNLDLQSYKDQQLNIDKPSTSETKK